MSTLQAIMVANNMGKAAFTCCFIFFCSSIAQIVGSTHNSPGCGMNLGRNRKCPNE